MNLSEQWSQTLDAFRNQFDDKVIFDSFMADMKAQEIDGNELVATTPYAFNVDMITEYIPQLEETYNSLFNTNLAIKIMSQDDYEKGYAKKRRPKIEEKIQKNFEDHLNPDFTFENFVVGNSNRIAQNASLAVAMKPGTAYSPLFIYSNSGLGKTHLLNAIGNFVKKRDKENKKRILYTSTENFVNDYVSSIAHNTIDEFNERYRSIDVLLIDDIQFIASKTQSSEMFFNIFNSLQNENKQIVITSDKPPKDLKGIENRLVSRFTNGLTVSIDTPEFETSKAILQKKLEIEKVDYPIEEDVLDFMASHFNRDIRELEGSLKRLLFYKLVFGSNVEVIDLEFALQAFADDYKKEEEVKKVDLSVDKIKKTVADYYNLSVAQINSKSRTSNIIVARHIAMYLVRNLLNDMSYIQIGKEFGGRDHSTVMKACDKVERNMKKDANYRRAVEELKKKLS
jgi:chromosomal replication initiator protein